MSDDYTSPPLKIVAQHKMVSGKALDQLRAALTAKAEEWERLADGLSAAADDPSLMPAMAGHYLGQARGLFQAAAEIREVLDGK